MPKDINCPNLSTPDNIIEYLRKIHSNEWICLYKQVKNEEYETNYFSTIIHTNATMNERSGIIVDELFVDHTFSNPSNFEDINKEYSLFISRDPPNNCPGLSQEMFLNPLVYWDKDRIYRATAKEEEKQYNYVCDNGELNTFTVSCAEKKTAFAKRDTLKEFLIKNEYQLIIYVYFRTVGIIPDPSKEEEKNFPTEKLSLRYYYDKENQLYGIDGKKIINFKKEKETPPEFIIGRNEDGSNNFARIDNWPSKSIQTLSFKASVLEPYKKYKFCNLEPRRLTCPGFSIQLLNRNQKTISVLAAHFKNIPIKEQHHWKHNNVPPIPFEDYNKDEYEVISKGTPLEPKEPSYVFQRLYDEVSKLWEKRFGFPFFMEITKDNRTKKHLSQISPISLDTQQESESETRCINLYKLLIEQANWKEMKKKISKDFKSLKKKDIIIEYIKTFKNDDFSKATESLLEDLSIRRHDGAHSKRDTKWKREWTTQPIPDSFNEGIFSPALKFLENLKELAKE